MAQVPDVKTGYIKLRKNVTLQELGVGFLKYLVKLSKANLRLYFVDCKRKLKGTFVK